MNPDPHQPRRLRRLDQVWIDRGYPTYFLTICTRDRQRCLANFTTHERFLTFIEGSATRYGWWVECYVLMPDHIHLFATPSVEAATLGKWIKALKAMTSQHEFKWQAGCFDHVLRNHESKSQKWDYVKDNPVRAGLVKKAEDWPYWTAFHPVLGTQIATDAASVTRPTSSPVSNPL